MPNWRALGRLTSSGLFSTFSLGGWLVVGTGRTSASRRRRELRRQVEAKPKPSLRGRKILIPRRIEVFASQPAFGERTSAGAGSIKGIPTRRGKGGRSRDRQIGTSSHRALDSRTTLHAPQSRSQIPRKAHKCSCQTPSGVREDGCREHREDRKPSKIGGPYRFLLRASFSHPDRLRRPRKGPTLAPPRTEKPGSAAFQTISHAPLRPPPSFGLFGYPPSPAIRPAKAVRRSAEPCFQTVAASDGPPPGAANNSEHV